MTRSRAWIGLVGLSLVVLAGCSGTLIQNLTKERTGSITIVFVNTTPYRVGFTYGTYDAWDRTPGPANVEQASLEPSSTSDPTTLQCARNMAVGTDAFIARAVALGTDEQADINLDLFKPYVIFSSAPADSDAADLPTEGTALGREVLLGVDYSCGDQLIFTFVEDPTRPGGFRVDYEFIRDRDLNDPA